MFEDVFFPEGYILILPGYTLQRATCGIYKAAAHRVVSHNLQLFLREYAYSAACCRNMMLLAFV